MTRQHHQVKEQFRVRKISPESMNHFRDRRGYGKTGVEVLTISVSTQVIVRKWIASQSEIKTINWVRSH